MTDSDVEQAILDAKHLISIAVMANANSANSMTNRTLRVLAENSEKQDWQDILTAPKDESWILAYERDANEDYQFVVRWDGKDAWRDNVEFLRHYPSHWMLLPEPPK